MSGSRPVLLEELSVSGSRSVLQESNTDDYPEQKKLSESRSIALIEISSANTDDDPCPKQKTFTVEVEVHNTDDDPRPKQKKLSESRSMQLKEVYPAHTDDPRPKQKKWTESRYALLELPNTAHPKLCRSRSA